MGLLEGKVAIITGAGNGIGRSHALLFGGEGARVVVNDPGCERDGSGSSDAADRVVAEIREQGGEAVASKAAVGSFEAAAEIVQTAVEAFGTVDILVNNAGILRDRTALKMSPEEWSVVLEVHLGGTFTCLQAAARVMKEGGNGGRIINTSSVAGLLGNFGQCNYAAAKAGIYALTRTAALELGRYGITVNTIAPNALTRINEDQPGIKDIEEMLTRTNGPQHVSPLVAYLASDKAAGITGQTLGVDGNHIYAYRMLTTEGMKKRHSTEPWTFEEIEPVLDQIINW